MRSALDLMRGDSGRRDHSDHRDRGDREWDYFLPRSILGMVALALAFALGAGLSGTILFAYYQFQQSSSTQKVDSFVNGFDQRYKTALATIAAQEQNAIANIQKAVAPIAKTQVQPGSLTGLAAKDGPAVWFVSTLDANGQPAEGSAFAVASSSSQTLLLASYTTIQAATHAPAPVITVSQNGGPAQPVKLQSWQAGSDLALLILPSGSQPVLHFAAASPAVGDQIYALSGFGDAITAGQVAGSASQVIQSNVQVGPTFQGGPLLDASGQVVGVASRTFAPQGFPSQGVSFGVPIQDACQQVLQCPPGGTPAA